ncbi:DUF5078 domain-containing protein, partial [Mycobacterium sp.]
SHKRSHYVGSPGARLFFNNKGVAAHGTDTCAQYPPSDPGVWVW